MKQKKNYMVLFLLQFFFILSFSAQETSEEKPGFKDKVVFGGNLFFSFGNVTFIEVSPRIGYRITPRLTSGIGGTYIYYRDKTFPSSVYKTNIYGGSIFTQYVIIPDLDKILPVGFHAGILTHIEYEALNMERLGEDTRFWQPNFYLGGGINIPIGRKSSAYLMLLYNLNYNRDAIPYQSNPILRFGILF